MDSSQKDSSKVHGGQGGLTQNRGQSGPAQDRGQDGLDQRQAGRDGFLQQQAGQGQGGFAHQRLQVWFRAVELVKLVKRQPIADAELRDQAMRAVRSVALNIAEGAALLGAAKRRHYLIARGSVSELAAAYELAEALGEPLPVATIPGQVIIIAAILTRLVR